MDTTQLIPVAPEWALHAHLSEAQYQKLYALSVEHPEAFWVEPARRIDWLKPWTRVKATRFQKPVSIQWFEGAELNVSANCVDRHAERSPERVAFFWEPEDPKAEGVRVTYRELRERVGRMGSILKNMGVCKGDRVTIYMPMIPEAVYAMLACARIGAVHSVVFGGFSADALADRIRDCDSRFLITADEGVRAGKTIPLKARADEAALKAGSVERMLVVRRTGAEVAFQKGRDLWYHEAETQASPQCAPVAVGAEDPLFILYTSGSTNKPKGVLHTSGGYLVYANYTFQMVFNYTPEQVYWCAADIGWITGHSYMVYGPLAAGTTSVLYEGVPSYPDASRIWRIVDKYQVNILYTAPTLLRSLLGEGDGFVRQARRSSLRLLGSVGEPINAEAWHWYYGTVGERRCPIVDTWWQTETGGILITPLPGLHPLKPSSATRPFFGVKPVLIDERGAEIQGPGEGRLCLADSWPGQMRTVYGNHARFEETYFSQFPGYYFTGDGCRRDENGYYSITGRVDDVINVSGHRLGTAEIESAIDEHPAVTESAVVGYPHPIKGQGIYAYVTLMPGIELTVEIEKEIREVVSRIIGPLAKPDVLHLAPRLPKTRSGKIMRRILRKIAEGEAREFGDTSTLSEPEAVEILLGTRPRT